MTTVTLSKIEKAVLQALAKRKGGIAARELTKILANKGYQENDVQRAMRRGLDRGDFELGPTLKLQVEDVAVSISKEAAGAARSQGAARSAGRAAARHLKR